MSYIVGWFSEAWIIQLTKFDYN